MKAAIITKSKKLRNVHDGRFIYAAMEFLSIHPELFAFWPWCWPDQEATEELWAQIKIEGVSDDGNDFDLELWMDYENPDSENGVPMLSIWDRNGKWADALPGLPDYSELGAVFKNMIPDFEPSENEGKKLLWYGRNALATTEIKFSSIVEDPELKAHQIEWIDNNLKIRIQEYE